MESVPVGGKVCENCGKRSELVELGAMLRCRACAASYRDGLNAGIKSYTEDDLLRALNERMDPTDPRDLARQWALVLEGLSQEQRVQVVEWATEESCFVVLGCGASLVLGESCHCSTESGINLSAVKGGSQPDGAEEHLTGPQTSQEAT